MISKMNKKAKTLIGKKEIIEKDISIVENDLLTENNDFQKITELLSQLDGEIRQFIYQKEKTEERILKHNTKHIYLKELIHQLRKSGEETKKELLKIEKEIENN